MGIISSWWLGPLQSKLGLNQRAVPLPSTPPIPRPKRLGRAPLCPRKKGGLFLSAWSLLVPPPGPLPLLAPPSLSWPLPPPCNPSLVLPSCPSRLVIEFASSSPIPAAHSLSPIPGQPFPGPLHPLRVSLSNAPSSCSRKEPLKVRSSPLFSLHGSPWPWA